MNWEGTLWNAVKFRPAHLRRCKLSWIDSIFDRGLRHLYRLAAGLNFGLVTAANEGFGFGR